MVYCCLKNNSKNIKFSYNIDIVEDSIGSCDEDSAPTTYPPYLFPIFHITTFAAAITTALT